MKPVFIHAILSIIAVGTSVIRAEQLVSCATTNMTSDVTSVGHAVRDLDKTVNFYHSVLGLVVLSQDLQSKVDKAYSQLTSTSSDTRYRSAIIEIPNQAWNLKLTQYYGLPETTVIQREQDPAAPGLTLTVKNASAVNDALRAANVTTLNGQPIPNGTAEGTTSTVWIYDPDGYMVECVQRSGASDYFTVTPPTITDGPGMEYVIRGQLDLTMANVSQALSFYKGVLGQNISSGFEPLIGPGEYEEIGAIGSIFGINSTVLWAAVTGNCDLQTRCEYYEYDDPTRVAIISPIQDPGIGLTTYVVKDLDSILEQVLAAGLTIVTEGGCPVDIDGTRSIIVRDPSGYLVRLDAKC